MSKKNLKMRQADLYPSAALPYPRSDSLYIQHGVYPVQITLSIPIRCMPKAGYTISRSSRSRSIYFFSGVRLAIQYKNPPKIAVNPLPVVNIKILLLIVAVTGL